MKKKIMKKWVKELRSGNYDQAQGALLVEDEKGESSFCCLGVLCNIYAHSKEGKGSGFDLIETWNGEKKEPFFFTKSGKLSSDAEPPRPVLKWAGLKTSMGDFIEDESLAGLNDMGKSFNEIADVIEQNWKVL